MPKICILKFSRNDSVLHSDKENLWMNELKLVDENQYICNIIYAFNRGLIVGRILRIRPKNLSEITIIRAYRLDNEICEFEFISENEIFEFEIEIEDLKTLLHRHSLEELSIIAAERFDILMHTNLISKTKLIKEILKNFNGS